MDAVNMICERDDTNAVHIHKMHNADIYIMEKHQPKAPSDERYLMSFAIHTRLKGAENMVVGRVYAYEGTNARARVDATIAVAQDYAATQEAVFATIH